jgi:hypothetical protein
MSEKDPKPKRRRLTRRRSAYEAALASPDFAHPDADADEGLQLASELVNAGSEAQGTEPRKVDPRLAAEIRVSLQDKVRTMLKEANRDPKSEAALMVYVLVLNEVATMEGLSSEYLKVLTEEHRRYSLIKQLERQRRELKVKELELRRATATINRTTAHMYQARDLANLTGHDLEKGKEVDMRGVCRKIAEIVGLAPPPQFTEGGQLNWDVAGGAPHAAKEPGGANGHEDENDAQ